MKEKIRVREDGQRFFVITGGPGSGKSALIEALQRSGYATSVEAGRSIIQDQVAVGGNALPWRDPLLFAEMMFPRPIICRERPMPSAITAACLSRRPGEKFSSRIASANKNLTKRCEHMTRWSRSTRHLATTWWRSRVLRSKHVLALFSIASVRLRLADQVGAEREKNHKPRRTRRVTKD